MKNNKECLQALKNSGISIDKHGMGYSVCDFRNSSFGFVGLYTHLSNAINAAEKRLKTKVGRSFSSTCYQAFIDVLLQCGFDYLEASAEWDALMDRT